MCVAKQPANSPLNADTQGIPPPDGLAGMGEPSRDGTPQWAVARRLVGRRRPGINWGTRWR